MDSLEYSIDALEIKSLFFNKDFTVYVEGEDDVIFWENTFQRCGKSVYVEELNGSNEVLKKINLIVEKDADFYVAIDNDYRDFKSERIEHKRIIVTHGHSIENTLYNKATIQRIIRQFSRKTIDISNDLSKIIRKFEEAIIPLLMLEIANELYDKKESILGRNCSRFLENNSSVYLCRNKIEEFINSKKNIFTKEELNEVKKKIDVQKKSIWFLVRGHFLTNFVINIIKLFVKKISSKVLTLPTDNIFPLFVDYIYLADDFPLLEKRIAPLF